MIQRALAILKALVHAITLQTPRDRLIVFAIVSLAVFFVPFHWLENLSIWKALDIPSPSIGLTRSYWLILHGDLVAAWNFNKLIYLILAIGVPLLLFDMRKLYQQHAREGTATSEN